MMLNHAIKFCLPKVMYITCLASILVFLSCKTKEEPEEVGSTWNVSIAPLVHEKCVSCHKKDGIGHMSFETYEQAKKWAPQMEAAILSNRMPPWAARETDECSPVRPFYRDGRLTQAQKDKFSEWVASETPEGDPAVAKPLPDARSLEVVDPNLQLTMPTDIVLDGTRDEYICFVLQPELAEKVWLTSSQIVPGNPTIAHHAQIYLDKSGAAKRKAGEKGWYRCFGGPGISVSTTLGIWAPGATPTVAPEDSGTPLAPGNHIIVQMHYHPSGHGMQVDSGTRLDLKWITEQPRFISRVVAMGNVDVVDSFVAGGRGFGLTTGPDFRIPAGATDHVEINRILVPGEDNSLIKNVYLRIYAIGTHMHYAGRDMKITVERRQGGGEECLVQTPDWNFNHQRVYQYEETEAGFPKIFPGDVMVHRCTYNNSLSNSWIRKALQEQGLTEPKDLRLGDGTLDEMCVGVYGILVSSLIDELLPF